MDTDPQPDPSTDEPSAPLDSHDQAEDDTDEPSAAAPADPADEGGPPAGAASTDQDGDLPDDEAALLVDGTEPNPYTDGGDGAQEDYR